MTRSVYGESGGGQPDGAFHQVGEVFDVEAACKRPPDVFDVRAILRTRPVPVPDHLKTEARYSRWIRIQVRREAPSRWRIWATNGGPWWRMKNLASPSLAEARRVVEHLHGSPIGGWQAPQETKEEQ